MAIEREQQELERDLEESGAVIDRYAAELRAAEVRIRRLEQENARLRVHARAQPVLVIREGLVP